MKTLFNSSDNGELTARIEALRPDTPARWGKMNAAQMLAHLQAPLRVGLGDVRLPQVFMGMLFGRLVLKTFISGKPWKHGMPTDRTFIIADRCDFDEEKTKLLILIRRFDDSHGRNIGSNRHPFFGKLSSEEWGQLMWSHINHHLDQFGK